MADTPAPAAPPRPRGQMLNLALMIGAMFLLFDERSRNFMSKYAGYVLEPTIGFGNRWPLLTIVLVGTLTVVFTTMVRHFTTDWLEVAKFQSHSRAVMKELAKARKENNTFKLKRLQEEQQSVQQRSMQVQQKQMATMPITTLAVMPLYAWLYTFLLALPYWHFSAPWNPTVDMFTTQGVLPQGSWIPILGTSVFPHWTAFMAALTYPLGILIQRSMKYLSWKERWQRRHPEVHEG